MSWGEKTGKHVGKPYIVMVQLKPRDEPWQYPLQAYTTLKGSTLSNYSTIDILVFQNSMNYKVASPFYNHKLI